MALKAISLFTGVGGLDYGFEAAGFGTEVALDIDPVACHTLRLNRPWRVLEKPIKETTAEELLDESRLLPRQADVLIGGPPCQPFSKSGYWARGSASRMEDPRAETLQGYLDILEGTLPRVFLIENVPGLNYRGKNEGFEAIQRGIDAINERRGTSYRISVAALNAASYGVPQLRERVFIVGSREGAKFRFPRPTHRLPFRPDSDQGLEPCRTVWDAIGDLPSALNDAELGMRGKWADLLPTIPEGQNYLWHTDRGGGLPLFGWRRRYWSFLLKLSKSLPSWTIQAQPGPATGPFHWSNRKLSAVELGRIQTFPDGLTYDCRHADVQRLVGNAVPSALGELLAREISYQLLGCAKIVAPLSLIPMKRGDIPEPEPIAPLPAKYASMVGEHEDHPGTGKGYRATGWAAAAVTG
ncbi:DNA cytosine methyltransferase [Lutibaculum baratangense]|uniref:DNA cytosine methyltransferase n=1 Tax=Lutibaculum baratangense TaxID=1358440 RepID=UPI00190F43FA|nr:DNA cytosine methyltransferase [Lutibaculum baratangense]